MSTVAKSQFLSPLASNGVVVTDAQGTIRFMNLQAESILQLDAAAYIGTYIVDLLPLTGPLVMTACRQGRCTWGRHIIGKHLDLVVNITAMKLKQDTANTEPF